jgi:NYN domain
MTQTRRAPLALLIDGDNPSPKIVSGLLREVALLGSPVVTRIYGNWPTRNLKGWKQSLRDFAIQPIQQFAHTPGKNATDGAMDLLYTARFSGFCIVSSDSDFARLAARIREHVATVYGFGERKTPRLFITTCDKFVYFDVLNAPAEEIEEAAVPAPQKQAEAKPAVAQAAPKEGGAG